MKSWLTHTAAILQLVLGHPPPSHLPFLRVHRAFVRGVCLRRADVPFPYLVIRASGDAVITIPEEYDDESRLCVLLGMLDLD